MTLSYGNCYTMIAMPITMPHCASGGALHPCSSLSRGSCIASPPGACSCSPGYYGPACAGACPGVTATVPVYSTLLQYATVCWLQRAIVCVCVVVTVRVRVTVKCRFRVCVWGLGVGVGGSVKAAGSGAVDCGALDVACVCMFSVMEVLLLLLLVSILFMMDCILPNTCLGSFHDRKLALLYCL